MNRWKADLLLVGLASISASIFLLTREMLEVLDPFTFLAFRFTIAAGAVILFFPHKVRLLNRKALRGGIVIGLALAAGAVSLTLGLRFSKSGEAAFVVNMSVVLVPLWQFFLFREKIGKAVMLGIFSASGGLFLLTGGDLNYSPGELWLLLAALAYASFVVSNAWFVRFHDPVLLALIQLTVVAALTGAMALLWETPRFSLSPAAWSGVLYAGIIVTGLRFCLQPVAQRFTPPTHTGLIFTLEPVMAGFYGWYFAGEIIQGGKLMGCFLILFGTLFARLGGGWSRVWK